MPCDSALIFIAPLKCIPRTNTHQDCNWRQSLSRLLVRAGTFQVLCLRGRRGGWHDGMFRLLRSIRLGNQAQPCFVPSPFHLEQSSDNAGQVALAIT